MDVQEQSNNDPETKEEVAMRSDKKRAIEALIGSVPLPPEYDDPNYDPDYELLREAAYKDRGLL
jgi:hypothetical protein